MNSVDAAWVAGIIEGEGTMGLNKFEVGTKRKSPKAYIKVAMTDEDVIKALHQKTGVGTVHGPYPGGGSKGAEHWKEQWVWHVSKRKDVRNLLTSILSFLYERRTVQAMTCLDAIDELDAAAEYRKNFCPAGHSKPECFEAYDNSHCKTCRITRTSSIKGEI